MGGGAPCEPPVPALLGLAVMLGSSGGCRVPSFRGAAHVVKSTAALKPGGPVLGQDTPISPLLCQLSATKVKHHCKKAVKVPKDNFWVLERVI